MEISSEESNIKNTTIKNIINIQLKKKLKLLMKSKKLVLMPLIRNME